MDIRRGSSPATDEPVKEQEHNNSNMEVMTHEERFNDL
jgi:hypothetical protein